MLPETVCIRKAGGYGDPPLPNAIESWVVEHFHVEVLPCENPG